MEEDYEIRDPIVSLCFDCFTLLIHRRCYSRPYQFEFEVPNRIMLSIRCLGRLVEFQCFQIEEKKQGAADVLFNYSKFVMACLGNQVRPCDLRLHLMKEVSGLPTTLKRDSSQRVTSPDAMGESSSSGTARLEKGDSFRAPQ